MKNLKVPCVEVKNCADRACPNYYSGNLKCWLGTYRRNSSPESGTRRSIKKRSPPVFDASIPVRGPPGRPERRERKVLTRESAVPISNLASEAGLALEVVSLYDSMKIMAVTDGLTGLYNHREFYQSLRRELERARRYRHTLSLLMIDVDDFKQFNDRFGHPAGDFCASEDRGPPAKVCPDQRHPSRAMGERSSRSFFPNRPPRVR